LEGKVEARLDPIRFTYHLIFKPRDEDLGKSVTVQPFDRSAAVIVMDALPDQAGRSAAVRGNWRRSRSETPHVLLLL
jgi:hypothetical protein